MRVCFLYCQKCVISIISSCSYKCQYPGRGMFPLFTNRFSGVVLYSYYMLLVKYLLVQKIDLSHNSHDTLDKYPKVHHFVTEISIDIYIAAALVCLIYTYWVPFQYKDDVLPVKKFHYGNKTKLISSYLHNWISYTDKTASSFQNY